MIHQYDQFHHLVAQLLDLHALLVPAQPRAQLMSEQHYKAVAGLAQPLDR